MGERIDGIADDAECSFCLAISEKQQLSNIFRIGDTVRADLFDRKNVALSQINAYDAVVLAADYMRAG